MSVLALLGLRKGEDTEEILRLCRGKMAARDEFLRDLDKATRVRNQLQLDFEERTRLSEVGESTSRMDSKLRGGIQELAVDVDSLIRTVHMYETDLNRYKMTPTEYERRRGLVHDLENDLNDIDEQLRNSLKGLKSSPVAGVKFKRDPSGEESADTRNLANKDLMQAKGVQFRHQAEIESAIVGTTENLVVAAKNMGDEVDLHNQLLDETEKNVDLRQTQMERTTYRMKELIRKSADGCMICCIVLLIVSLVLIIVFA